VADKYIPYLNNIKFKTNDIIKKSLINEEIETHDADVNLDNSEQTFLSEKNIINTH
jgi:hypothetical protein